MPSRRCLTPGCRNLTTGSYCTDHDRKFGRPWRTQTSPQREAARNQPCPECGEPMIRVSMHHTTPVGRGGGDGQLEAMCVRCNSRKGS